MHIVLKENERIIAECSLQEFTATLTNLRLIIKSSISEENFPLRGISGVGIYDDVDKYVCDLQAAKKTQQTKAMGLAAGLGIILFVIASVNNQLMMGVIGIFSSIAIGLLFAYQTPSVPLMSILNIMQQGGSRQFRFYKNDQNALAIKTFVDKVTDTLN